MIATNRAIDGSENATLRVKCRFSKVDAQRTNNKRHKQQQNITCPCKQQQYSSSVVIVSIWTFDVKHKETHILSNSYLVCMSVHSTRHTTHGIQRSIYIPQTYRYEGTL